MIHMLLSLIKKCNPLSQLQFIVMVTMDTLAMSICLFVWSLSSHLRIFHSYGDVTIAGEGLQILTNARHSWPLSSEGLFSVPNLM